MEFSELSNFLILEPVNRTTRLNSQLTTSMTIMLQGNCQPLALY